MTREQWDRLKPIFHGALEQPTDLRRAWLEQACGDDISLLRAAESLLNAHDTAGDFLEHPAQMDPVELDTLPEGTTLGTYRIVRELGRGGMGVVYLATDNLGRNVAIKTLPPVLAANPALRERLRREAHAAARINHPAVATVHVFDEMAGHLVVVSEYVPGDTLRTLLTRGGIESTHAAAIAVDIAGALAAAHEAGVVHRDLKPENVVVTPGGRVKVVDFGIAHIEAPGNVRLTVDGMMIGTPAYMAPEQRAGGPVTPSTDVYSFGIVFAEMLTGRHPLSIGGSASGEIGLRRNPPYSVAGLNPVGRVRPTSNDVGRVPPEVDVVEGGPAGIPPRLQSIIDRCIKVDPGERYASGRELLAALTGHAAPITPSEDDRTERGSPRWWWEFHQAFIAALYWLMAWPAWQGRQIIGGPVGRALFIATLIAVIVAVLRLHLWFTSRFYPAELHWARRRSGTWVRFADWLFVSSLAVTGVLVGEDRSPVAILLLAVAVGAAIAFLVIEPATERAAFRTSTTARA